VRSVLRVEVVLALALLAELADRGEVHRLEARILPARSSIFVRHASALRFGRSLGLDRAMSKPAR
jgi:hypothetical protein